MVIYIYAWPHAFILIEGIVYIMRTLKLWVE